MVAHRVQQLCYLGCMVILIYCIKRWYSHANLNEMQWLMLPLANLLDLFLPGQFELQGNGVWFHAGWQILLVKGCSGVNFFLMSLTGYALVFARQTISQLQFVWFHWLLRILLALAATWLTTLIVNVIRILLAMSFIRHPSLVDWMGLDAGNLHRLAGLLVYFPALFAQMQFDKFCDLKRAYLQAVLITTFMLILVPLLTGNAFNHQAIFFKHCSMLLVSICNFGLLLFFLKNLSSKIMYFSKLRIEV